MQRNPLLALSLLCAAAPAAAVDAWSGAHAGAFLGHAGVDAAATATLNGNWATETPALRRAVSGGLSGNADGDGLPWGVLAGYDMALANGLVLGLEAEAGDINTDETATRLARSGTLAYTVRQGVDLGTSYALRARLGFALDSLLAYATLGWAWTDIDAHTSLREASNGYAKAARHADTLEQMVWGLGVEYRFAATWSGRLEYLRYEDDEIAYATGYEPGSTFPGYGERIRQDVEAEVIRLGVSYRF